MSLLFNMLSRLVITFLPRSKRLLISWLQSPSAVILEHPKTKSDTVSTVSPSISQEVMGPDAMILVFWMLSFKPTFSLFSFTFIMRFFSSSSLYAIRVVSSAYLRLLIFLPAILITACASSRPAFLMVYSACKLNKQGDNIQPWRTPFPIWNQSVVPCPVLTVASWPAYRFLKNHHYMILFLKAPFDFYQEVTEYLFIVPVLPSRTGQLISCLLILYVLFSHFLSGGLLVIRWSSSSNLLYVSINSSPWGPCSHMILSQFRGYLSCFCFVLASPL